MTTVRNVRNIRRRPAGIMLGGLLALGPVLTAGAGGNPSGTLGESAPAAIKLLLDEGAEVSAPFDVPDGLTGYAVRLGGRDMIAYVTGSGQYLLLSNMISADGVSLTERHLHAHALPAGDENLWKSLEASDWIGIGGDSPSRVIYTFTDARCPYCNALWRESKQYIDDDLQVRHILVAVLGENSWGQGAAILSAPDPAAALTDHEENYRAGGIAALGDVPAAVRGRLARNNELMRAVGVSGTPATFYWDEDGDIRMVAGMPAKEKVAEIFGGESN